MGTWNTNKMILVRTGAKIVVNESVVVIVGEEERVKIAEDAEKMCEEVCIWYAAWRRLASR